MEATVVAVGSVAARSAARHAVFVTAVCVSFALGLGDMTEAHAQESPSGSDGIMAILVRRLRSEFGPGAQHGRRSRLK